MKELSLIILLPLFTSSVLANTRGIPIPHYRFKLWRDLDNTATGYATLLAYDRSTWNAPGEADIEFFSYESIVNASMEQGSAVDGLGFNEEVWDCYVNHYSDYLWEEMETAELSVRQYFEVLGWTEASWTEVEDPPASEEAFWDDLNAAEQAAAAEICYTPELWNGLTLDLWPELPTAPDPTSSPTLAPTMPLAPSSTSLPTLSPVPPTISPTDMPTLTRTEPPTSSPTTPSPTVSTNPTMQPTGPTTLPPAPIIEPVDDIRYVVWSNLTNDIRMNAESLAYTEESWNSPGSASIEGYSFGAIESLQIQGGNAAITAMGLTEVQWDCFINHYDYYAWSVLEDARVQVYLRALGWTEESWNEEVEAPMSDTATWAELSEKEKQAAEGLCYRMETWEDLPLTEWGREATEAPSASPVDALTQPPVTPATDEPTLSPTTDSSSRPIETISVCLATATLAGLAALF